MTSLSPDQLSPEEAIIIARLRWQIELLFKLWKSHGQLDKSVSEQPWRILCEFYAKLLAMIVQHRFFLTCCWAFPARVLVKATKTVRQHAFALLLVPLNPLPLPLLLVILSRTCCTEANYARCNMASRVNRVAKNLLPRDEW